jgi:formylglycine-generating enzyme required for sulfatase activity
MPRLQTLLECIGKAVCEHGLPTLSETHSLSEVLLPIARTGIAHINERIPSDQLRDSLQEAISVPTNTLTLTVNDAVSRIANQQTESIRDLLARYLTRVPNVIRQFCRRPGDVDGDWIPEQLEVDHAEDWLPLLPDRLFSFQEDDQPELDDPWRLIECRGLGVGCEVWLGIDETDPQNTPRCLKFITEPELAKDFIRHKDHFIQILELDSILGIIPLRSVHLLGKPPCLEYEYYSGYDLTGLMNDWRWRYPFPKPEHAILILRRLVKSLGRLHRHHPPIIHGGLKPSNILVHPTPEGKATVWIADLGWGAISSEHALQVSHGVTDLRQTRRGALTSLYTSPERLNWHPLTPRDDVYALGMIWYQILKRDPTASAPEGMEWAEEFRDIGLSEGQARLISTCIDPNPEKRPRDAAEMASQLEANLHHSTIDSGSKVFQLAGTGSQPSHQSSSENKPGSKTHSQWTTENGSQKDALHHRPTRFVNSVGIEFVLVPAGTFWMGSPEDERGRHDWESPQHEVTISHSFYLSVYPILQSEYQAVLGRNPSAFTKLHGGGPDHPVEQVSWEDAVAFCDRLMAKAPEAESCRAYRLPTEAEWEYACRAGTSTAYSFGDSISLKQAHYFGMDPARWSRDANPVGKTTKIGAHPPNPWGLCDMHGNVLEWCADWWNEDYYNESPPIDPQGPEEGRQRVVRGGSFSQFAAECRSAARMGRAPNTRLNTIGFRIVLAIGG